MRTTTATLHALPACDEFRRQELRRAAKDTGIRYIPAKFFVIKASPSKPFGGDAA